jgi:hypothetical protein
MQHINSGKMAVRRMMIKAVAVVQVRKIAITTQHSPC